MNQEQKELMKKVAIGASAIGLIGVGYFVGKNVAFKICERNVGINIINWLSSLQDKEEARRLLESFDSYGEKCTIKATGILLPK